jgi:hypothetical protein
VNTFEEALIQIKNKVRFYVQNKPTVTFGTQTGDLDEKTCENYDIN